MSDKKKSAKKWQEKLEKQSGRAEENKRKREAAFVPPKVRITSLFKYCCASPLAFMIKTFFVICCRRTLQVHLNLTRMPVTTVR
jgi:ribosomal RNA assembly protein